MQSGLHSVSSSTGHPRKVMVYPTCWLQETHTQAELSVVGFEKESAGACHQCEVDAAGGREQVIIYKAFRKYSSVQLEVKHIGHPKFQCVDHTAEKVRLSVRIGRCFLLVFCLQKETKSK